MPASQDGLVGTCRRDEGIAREVPVAEAQQPRGSYTEARAAIVPSATRSCGIGIWDHSAPPSDRPAISRPT